MTMNDTDQLEDELSLRARERRSRQVVGLALVGVGAVVGVTLLHWWAEQRERSLTVSREASEPRAVSSSASPPEVELRREPITEALALPATPEDYARLRKIAEDVVRIDGGDAQMWFLWCRLWPVRYPGDPVAGDHPSVARAMELTWGLVRERQAQAKPEPQTPAPEPSTLAQATAPTEPVCETPRPGHFYRVRAGEVLLGEEGIVAQALREAVLDAARERGLSLSRARLRARRLAAKQSTQRAYAAMISTCQWNRRRAAQRVPGAVLWLPPLSRASLLERKQGRRVVLEQRPWPDGVSKLEPPPDQHPPPASGVAGEVRAAV